MSFRPFVEPLLNLLDIVLVGFFLYQLLLRFRGSPARPAFFGLLVLLISYLLSQYAGLLTLQWLMNHFVQNLFLILVILFQNEIRRALILMGQGKPFFRSSSYSWLSVLDEILKAVQKLRDSRTGALLVLERDTPLKEVEETGVPLDALVREELLVSIFQPSSPLHDGATIIHRDRVVSAGCFLPLNPHLETQKALGTRHQSALTITEETDAIAIVVSEERGTISLAWGGKLYFSLTPTELQTHLQQILKG
jgi:uncharacterized protein (TIGR00159 family)